MVWLALGVGSLLVLVFIIGDRVRRWRGEAAAYLRGVRYVLSDDPDAAIEALSDGARMGGPESEDAYLALGALFRRTGDFARAIRLHRNLLLRDLMDLPRRREVERELASDYRRSGMHVEAIEIYRKLAAQGELRAQAWMRDAYCDQGDWLAAVEVQRLIGSPDKTGSDPVMAHLLAGASRALRARPLEARQMAEEALAACPTSSDARLALAEVAAANGDKDLSLLQIAAALDLDPTVGDLAWPALSAVTPPEAALQLVQAHISARTPRPPLGLELLRVRLLYAVGRSLEAFEALSTLLPQDVTGEAGVVARDLLTRTQAVAAQTLSSRHQTLVALLSPPAGAAFRCAACGVESVKRSWRCNQCGSFDTIVMQIPTL